MNRFLLALVALALPTLAHAEAPGDAGAAPTAATAHDFDAELAALWRVAACVGDGDLDAERFPPAVVERHCAALAKTIARYRKTWLTPARPFFETLVPKDLPKTVVYPFAGGDLLTALAVFPDLTNLTTVSLEAGGDPRGIFRDDRGRLGRHLELHRRFLDELVTWNHNRTLDLAALNRTPLPSQLIFALVGLAVHGFEPVRLRAITLDENGHVVALGDDDLATIDASVASSSGTRRTIARNNALANYELVFRKTGTTEERVYHHFKVNLSDDHLTEDPRLIRYLDGLGKVSAMTKAASHLLWHDAFSTMRQWLQAHIVWMVSDSTGLNPSHLDPKAWQQTCYGSFHSAVFNPTAAGIKALRAHCKDQPKRPLPMKFFGYPTKRIKGFLLVTQPRSGAAEAPPQAAP